MVDQVENEGQKGVSPLSEAQGSPQISEEGAPGTITPESTNSSPEAPTGLSGLRSLIDRIPSPDSGPSVLGAFKEVSHSLLNLMEQAAGEREISPESVFKDTLNVGGTSIAFNSLPRNAVGTFGGFIGASRIRNEQVAKFKKARDLDKQLRDLPRFKNSKNKLAADAVIGDKVYSQTGWFKSPIDNQWRFHIDDRNMNFTKLPEDRFEDLSSNYLTRFIDPVSFQSLKDNPRHSQTVKTFQRIALEAFARDDKVVLGDIIKHDNLFKVYPELKNVKIRFDAKANSAAFYRTPNVEDSTINISSYDVMEVPERARQILLHEIQHAIQGIENFPKGASTETIINTLLNRLDTVSRILEVKGEEQLTDYDKVRMQEIKKIRDWFWNVNAPGREFLKYTLYRAQPGELESSVVERMYADRFLPPGATAQPSSLLALEDPGPIPIIPLTEQRRAR